MLNDQWIPRRCSAEYLEARQQELDALSPEHYSSWNTEANLAPESWAEKALKAGIVFSVIGMTFALGWGIAAVCKGIAS